MESEQVWSPDGNYLIFSSDAGGADSLYRKRADGSGEIERLTTAEKHQWAGSWSRDGRYVAYTENDTIYDVGVLDLETGKTADLLATPFGDGYPAISPNGRWLAYSSNESGAYEVYVRPFPGGVGKWQVSDSGGSSPRWSGDGRELFWRNDAGVVVVEAESDGDGFRAGKATQLFTGAFKGGRSGVAIGGFQFTDYDVSADGQRFVMWLVRRARARSAHSRRAVSVSRLTGDRAGPRQITLVTHWFDECAPTAPTVHAEAARIRAA
jgi:serine/threonine-protein kinase